MDTARTGAGRVVGHANRQGPWLAPGERSLAGPGIRDFLIRYFVNSDSTADVERRWSASCVAQAASERGSMGTVHRTDRYYVQRRAFICIHNPDAYGPRACVRLARSSSCTACIMQQRKSGPFESPPHFGVQFWREGSPQRVPIERLRGHKQRSNSLFLG